MTATAPPQTQPQTPQPQAAPAAQPAQPMPPTGLEQQLASINQTRRAASTMGAQIQPSNTAIPGGGGPQQGAVGNTSLSGLAESLARSYGLALPRGDIVDNNGNFLVTPDQVASASGGRDTMGTAAAKMNYIAQALQQQQQKGELMKSEAALSSGLGLVQKRGRGSLATMQSGFYQQLSSLYQGQQHKAADFSYFIQKEQLDLQNQILARQERLAKKQARGNFVTGLGMTAIGILSGQPQLAIGGAAQAGGSAGSTGWF